MVGDMQGVGQRKVGLVQRAVGKMRLQGAGVGAETRDGGAQAQRAGAPVAAQFQGRGAGNRLAQAVAHLPASFEKRKGRSTGRGLEGCTFGLWKTVSQAIRSARATAAKK